MHKTQLQTRKERLCYKVFGGRDGYEVLPEKMGLERGAVVNLTKREEEC